MTRKRDIRSLRRAGPKRAPYTLAELEPLLAPLDWAANDDDTQGTDATADQPEPQPTERSE